MTESVSSPCLPRIITYRNSLHITIINNLSVNIKFVTYHNYHNRSVEGAKHKSHKISAPDVAQFGTDRREIMNNNSGKKLIKLMLYAC